MFSQNSCILFRIKRKLGTKKGGSILKMSKCQNVKIFDFLIKIDFELKFQS